MKFDADNVLYETCDLIVHDCETGPFQSGVHAHYDQLRTLSAEVKAKMLLVHYQDNVFGSIEDMATTHRILSPTWIEKATSDGFAKIANWNPALESVGFVARGTDIDLDEWFNKKG